jgi:UDPglucose 6-dehydrogenase
LRIAVAGLGYVGLTNAVLLAQNNPVIALDIDAARVELVNARQSPIADPELEEFLRNRALDLSATVDAQRAYSQADYVIVATPTNYDPLTHFFDTSSVEEVIEQVSAINPSAVIVIKSTIPVGFVEQARARFASNNIIFCRNFFAGIFARRPGSF